MAADAPVLIVLGSKSDLEVGRRCAALLESLGIASHIKVASAHRTPALVVELACMRNVKVFVAIAGLSAALPGALAAHTVAPVIGVPISGKLNLDAILSMVQMPPGIPVATVGLDAGENAALLAAEILAVSDRTVRARLEEHRRKQSQKVLDDSRRLSE